MSAPMPEGMEGIVARSRAMCELLPLVVRLAGTNVEAGQRILAESGYPVVIAETLAEAADKAVAAWRGTRPGRPET